MPIYEYKCENCNQDVEIFHKTLKVENILCPQCGSDKLEKQWSVPGFLKNSGASSEEMPCGQSSESCKMPYCPAKKGHVCGM